MRERLTKRRPGRNGYRAILGASSALALSVLLMGSAFADDAPTTTPTPIHAKRKPTAQAVEEVVVTAEYKKEKLQEAPIAISVFSGKNLEMRNITNISQLSAGVPNAVIQPLGAGYGSTIAAFIRGVGLNDNSLSFEPGVPIYIDDVYNGRPQAAILDLIDVDRVEVLRGPQGTLFGKNAIGGAVRIIGKKPTGDGRGYLEMSTGSYNEIGGGGAIDETIVPNKLMARFAFSAKKQDGYGTILDYTCATGQAIPGGAGAPGLPSVAIPSRAHGGKCVVGHEGGVNDKSARLALRWIVSDNIEDNFVGDYTLNQDQAPVSKYTQIDSTPSNFLVSAWNALVAVPVFGVPLGNQFLTGGKYTNYGTYSDPLTGISTPNENNVQHWGVVNKLDYQIPDIMHIKMVTAYRQFENDYGRNSDGSPLPFNRTFDVVKHQQISQEVDLTGTLLNEHLEWASGIYYYNSNDSDRETTILLPFFPAPISSRSYDVVNTQDYAAFLHGVYHFTDKLSMTAGVRYTADEKQAHINQVACCNIPAINGSPIINNVSLPISASRVSPLAELEYKWTPDLMSYAEYSTGFRGGGFGPRPSDAYQVRSFAPEDLRSYEVGVKSDEFDHMLTLNGAVFYSIYTNQQIGFNTIQPAGTPGAGAPWFETVNTGKSDMYGFEGEFVARPITNMLLQGSFGYLHYYRVDLGEAAGQLLAKLPNGTVVYPPQTPEFNASIGAQYEIPLGKDGSDGSLTPRVDWHWQSAVFFTSAVAIGQDAYSTVDARLTWQTEDRKWAVSAYGTNITNTYYDYGKLSLQSVLGFEQANPAPPAEWGLSVKRSF